MTKRSKGHVRFGLPVEGGRLLETSPEQPMAPATPHVHVIYCDDIRHEVGGKYSLVGVYNADLYLPSFPATIPKLCVLVAVTAQLQTMYSKLSINVEFNGTPLMETGDLSDDVAAIKRSMSAETDPWGEPAAIFNLQFVISPFAVDRQGVLAVQVTADGVRLMAPALRVAMAPQKKG